MIIYLLLIHSIFSQEGPRSQILSQSSLVRFEQIINENSDLKNDSEFETLLNEKQFVLYREGLNENLLHLITRKNNLRLLNKTLKLIDKLDQEKQKKALCYQNIFNESPLMTSLKHRSNTAFILLLQQLKKNTNIFLTSISAVDSYQQNIMHYSVISNNDLAVNMLLQETMSFRNRQNWLNTQDFQGKTSFYRATENNNFGIMAKLIEADCDINIPDIMGRRAIDIARNSENQELKNFFGIEKECFFTRCFGHVRFRR
jgi:hypothetical protein